MNTKGLSYLITAFVFTLFGLFMAKSEIGEDFKEQVASTGTSIRSSFFDTAINQGVFEVKTTLFLEHPEIIDALLNENLFGRQQEAITKIRDTVVVTPLEKRTWQIQLDHVNSTLFETDAGLVLIDTGMAPAGPALVEAIQSVSDQPLHTVIYTQGHPDHAYGTWSLLEAGWNPEIIAHEGILNRFEKYIQMRGALARLMGRPLHRNDDLVWPTQTFRDSLDLEIGGEVFTLKHHQGVTDDQLYVWVSGRKTVISADYMENGLEHTLEWITVLREMEELDAKYLIPGHGDALTNSMEINEKLTSLADSLEMIRNETLVALSNGKSKEEILKTVKSYPVSIDAVEVSESVIRRYASWSPQSNREQAQVIVEMAGGIDAVVQKARMHSRDNLALASQLAEWAYLANPESFEAQQVVIEIFKERIIDPSSRAPEILNYIDLMAEARARQTHSRNL